MRWLLLNLLSYYDLTYEIVELADKLRRHTGVGNNPIDTCKGSQDRSTNLIEFAVVDHQDDFVCALHAGTEALDLGHRFKHYAVLEVDGPSSHD